VAAVLTEAEVRARIAAATASDLPSFEGNRGIDDGEPQRVAENWLDPIRAGLAYYRMPDRRMPRGRIVLLQNGMNAMEMIQYRDRQTLSRYGGYHGANQINDWQRTDPFLGIIQRGGIHEFDAEQIIDMQWHYEPGPDAGGAHRWLWERIGNLMQRDGLSREEAVCRVMPQLAGYDLEDYPCALCPGRHFTQPEHRDAHRSVMHPDNVQTEGTRDAVAAALATSGSNMGDLVSALTLLVEQMAADRQAQMATEPARKGRAQKAATDDE
jgi:hypothetical protein